MRVRVFTGGAVVDFDSLEAAEAFTLQLAQFQQSLRDKGVFDDDEFARYVCACVQAGSRRARK